MSIFTAAALAMAQRQSVTVSTPKLASRSFPHFQENGSSVASPKEQ